MFYIFQMKFSISDHCVESLMGLPPMGPLRNGGTPGGASVAAVSAWSFAIPIRSIAQ